MAEQRLRAPRVLVQPVGHIEHAALDDDPQVVFLVMLLHLLHAVLLLWNLKIHWIGRLGDLAWVRAVRFVAFHDRGDGFLRLPLCGGCSC